MADEKSQLKYKISADSKELVDGVNEGLRSVKEMTDKVKDGNNAIGATAQNATSKVKGLSKEAANVMASFAGYALSIVGIAKAAKDAFVYTFWQKQVDALEEASDAAKRNAESIRSVSDQNENARRETDDYMKRLGELAKKEKLSNAEKVEQQKLLKGLSAGYSDLVKIMADSEGKIRNFDQAMAAKLKRDHERLMAETQQEMAEIKRQMDAQREIATGGNAFWDLVTFGKSGKKSLEAAEKLNALTDQYAKLMKKTHDMKKEDPAADYLREANAAKQDKAEAEKEEKQKKAMADAMDGMKRLDEASAKYAEAEKRRSKALADEQVRQDKIVLDSRLSRLKRQADAERQRLGSFGFSLDVNPNESASSRRGRVRRMQLDASIAEKQEAQRSGERVRYTAQERRRIADYRDSSRKLAKTEEQIAQLEAAGKAAEAARQQQAAADRLSESATALNQAAIELRAAGGSAPVTPVAQPAETQPAPTGKSLPPVQTTNRANVAAGVSQVVSYGPMLGKIINLLQTRAFVIRNS